MSYTATRRQGQSEDTILRLSGGSCENQSSSTIHRQWWAPGDSLVDGGGALDAEAAASGSQPVNTVLMEREENGRRKGAIVENRKVTGGRQCDTRTRSS